MTGALRQLAALFALRWQMARGTGLRLAVLVSLAVVLWLLSLALSVGELLDAPTLAAAIEIAPAAYLGFGALALVAPLTAGGGTEVVPPDQLTAYPVRPAAQLLGGLALAPVNLVWVLQLLVLAGLTSCLTLGGSTTRGAVTTAAYVALLTAIGQGLAWTVTGLRHTRTGRRLVGGSAVALVAAAVLAVREGRVEELLTQSPTRLVVQGVIAGGEGDLLRWGATTGALVAALALALVAGVAACGWALRRSGEAARRSLTGPVRRRPARRGALRELVAVDRASVWRAPALRRGGLVLALLPGLLAAGSAVPWESMIVLPGLVAAGAGLLFGINAFCLDGPGALWLASLPHPPRLAAAAKALVLTETVLGAVLIAVLAGSLRSPGAPSAAELSAIVASVVTCTAVVVAGALRTSLLRPHRADLRGPRDAVAPPGAMAAASVRLALPTAAVGVLLSAASHTGTWWWPPLVATPVLLLAVLSLLRSLRRYDDPVARARVVHAVSAG